MLPSGMGTRPSVPLPCPSPQERTYLPAGLVDDEQITFGTERNGARPSKAFDAFVVHIEGNANGGGTRGRWQREEADNT